MMNEKNTEHWPLQVCLHSETVNVNGWDTDRWKISALLPDQSSDEGHNLTLELHKDERTAYRFNLNSESPHLFVLCNQDEASGDYSPVHITASQDDAASYMDGEHQLLETLMPPAIQCWIDTYLGIHGELIDEGKKKKKRGKGRSSGR